VPADVKVRAGGPADAAFVLDLGTRTLPASVSSLRPAPLELVRRSYERLVGFASEQSHVIVVAESAVERLGFALAVDDLPDEVTGLPQSFVAYMAVEPHARRRGIGRALLGAIEAAARERGVGHVALMVTEDNMAARQMYAQAGYLTERRLLCKAL
jgi:ribosomal protein S18 acetylase RimI-like enzyme